MINTAVILAAGLGSRLRPYTNHQPKGFLKIYEDMPSLIELSIQALQQNGITNIIIGTGYKREFYEQLATKYEGVHCVYSPKYSTTGSLTTLINLYSRLKGIDFILLESDLLYDPNGIRELMWHKETNVILASNPTQSNDEVYIEATENNFLINLSKKESELKTSIGELTGITKISSYLYQQIKILYDKNPKCQLWDYENALVALKNHKIYIHKIPNYVWCEIDNEEHLNFARQTILPKLKLINEPLKREILLNPGPATTSLSVKYAQIQPDICPREKEFADVMQYVTDKLTGLVAPNDGYSTVLFPGSGTAAVEAILSSAIGPKDHLLIIHNGAYGKRMQEICDAFAINYTIFDSPYTSPLNYTNLENFITNRPFITHLAVVHNETTTGLLNDINLLGDICKNNNLLFIVDAMSSYAALPIQMDTQNIHYLAASSNKNIQGMAGIGFVIASNSALESIKNYPTKSYYLNLYAQYEYFKNTGQCRFTPPVQVVYALQQAIIEIYEEGVKNRYQRYTACWQILIDTLKTADLKWAIPLEHQSKIITAIYEPDLPNYNFENMHDELLKQGFTIYPGKIGNLNTFRLANIGDLTVDDMHSFSLAFLNFFKKITE